MLLKVYLTPVLGILLYKEKKVEKSQNHMYELLAMEIYYGSTSEFLSVLLNFKREEYFQCNPSISTTSGTSFLCYYLSFLNHQKKL